MHHRQSTASSQLRRRLHLKTKPYVPRLGVCDLITVSLCGLYWLRGGEADISDVCVACRSVGPPGGAELRVLSAVLRCARLPGGERPLANERGLRACQPCLDRQSLCICLVVLWAVCLYYETLCCPSVCALFDCLLAWSCCDGLICHSDLTRKFLIQQRARSEL